MSFHSWLQSLRSRTDGLRAGSRPAPATATRTHSLRAATHRPNLEVLKRLTPSSPGSEFPLDHIRPRRCPRRVCVLDFTSDGIPDQLTITMNPCCWFPSPGPRATARFATHHNSAPHLEDIHCMAVADVNGERSPRSRHNKATMDMVGNGAHSWPGNGTSTEDFFPLGPLDTPTVIGIGDIDATATQYLAVTGGSK